MRAWAAIGAFLVWTSAAAAAQPIDPVVPPLADGESAPTDAPNYFDARELGVATLAALAVCQEAVTGAAPDLDEAMRARYCECFADTARANARAARPVMPTEPQTSRCAEVARNQIASPFARQFTTSTPSIVSFFEACLADPADGASASYHGFVCGCATNAWIADRQRANNLDQDLARCVMAGRYREDTGQTPTLRQFAAIRVTPPRAHSGPGAPMGSPRPGEFIPYRGNGGGPTLCNDGMYSRSSGSGTCAHHGGVSGGRPRRR